MIVLCHQVFLQQATALDILGQIWENIVTIGIVIGIVGGITGIILFYDWIRPKVKNVRIISSHINYETNEMVEEKEMEITWPHFPFFKTISLPRFPRDARYVTAYKASVWPKQKLDSTNYTVSEAGKYRKIKLVNKEFCTENDVELIYLTCFIPQAEDYRRHIREMKEANKIIVLNDNLTEVKNYRVLFPKKVTMNKANRYFPIVERFETDQSSSDEAVIIALILKPLPPSKSGEPGRIEIPL